MYKLLALDLDGTLLNSRNEISDNNKQMIRKAKEQGTEILLISGRPYVSMKYIADELKLEECLIVALAGCDIRKYPSDESIFCSKLSKDQIQLLNMISNKLECYLQIFRLDGSYYYPKKTIYSQMYEDYFQYSGNEIDFNNIVFDDICKAMYIMEPEELLEKEAEIKNLLHKGLRAEPIWENIIDIYSDEVDKGKGIMYVANQLGISCDEIIACGDEIVDLSMIQKSGLGVAMGNAVDRVKEIADIVTLTNDDDGVAAVIEKYILHSGI
jgi:Cof subfamily protein (haloacid dehalogenase superfamily)